jgi:hypothetical protein
MMEDLELTCEKLDVPWQGVDVIAKVKEDEAAYVRCFIASWMNDVFAYVVVRFAEMTGVGFRNTHKNFEDFISKLNELSAKGVRLYKESSIEVDMGENF